MTLSALTAWEPAGDAAAPPVLRSAMEHRLRAAGATFEARGAWLVPASVPGEAERLERLGFTDASHLGKLEVRGGAEPAEAPDRHVVRVGPGRWIVLCGWEARAAVAAELADGRDLLLDMSGAWSLLLIAGADADRLLRRLGPVAALPTGGPIADVPGRIFRRAGLLWILVPVEYAQHVWDVCADRAEPLGGGPVGLDALVARAGDALLAAPVAEAGR